MSFYTSLTGLNAASAQLGVTSNNVANVGTVGFKKSRAEFGDIFSSSPLENSASIIGQGVLLKTVGQEFSQGNIEFSSNSLDMAVSGQGFFALKPSLTSNHTVYTRAGSFSANNDRHVVDSTGQFLQVLPVNEDGSVIATGLESAKPLQLPQTSGLPQATSKIELGINLPANAEIIPQRPEYTEDNPYQFDRNDSSTFNKSTSITVYDSLGNPYIATLYYVKTGSSTEGDPTNKWDTHIYIGEEALQPSLLAAKSDKGETLYMNKFGRLSTDPAKEDPNFNPHADHPLYYLDDQQTQRPSERGQFIGGDISTDSGHDFGTADNNPLTFGAGATSGSRFFSISADGSDFISIDIPDGSYTGAELAEEMTRQINAGFGDERYYQMPTLAADRQISIELQATDEAAHANSPLIIELDDSLEGQDFTRDQLIEHIQSKIGSDLPVKVGFDLGSRQLTFTSSDSDYTRVKATGSETFGLGVSASFAVDAEPFSSAQIVPTGEQIVVAKQQRAGIEVNYLKDEHRFAFYSGTTGEASSLRVAVPSGSALTGGSNDLLGIGASYAEEIVEQAGTGLQSSPGMTTGTRAGVDISGVFAVTAADNVINVTVDGVQGRVEIPPGDYTGHSFSQALQQRINLIEDEQGRQVSGVQVAFNAEAQHFSFTSATVGHGSFVNINGHANWGFEESLQVRGSVPEVTLRQQARDSEGNLLYIDRAGNETTTKSDRVSEWVPVYLDKGELSYDTFGKLISPREGLMYSSFNPHNGADLLNLSIDYGTFSTQYSSPFSVLSLSQDGYTSGRLDGLDIDAGGVVRANYTNGQQVALGKVMMANFANTDGLKQVGNASYVETFNSGEPVLGEAGADGFGTLQSGALERSNVDLTQELVNLITAQRNFQANAKAIETSSSLTQTIINIRG